MVKIEVDRLTIGDSDDPELIAGFVLGDWAATEKGQWCKQHLGDLSYICRPNINTMGFDVIVYGEIEPGAPLTEFLLRWS